MIPAGHQIKIMKKIQGIRDEKGIADKPPISEIISQ
jgi:hypothetical protein